MARPVHARSLLRALLVEMLPLSDAARAEAPIWAAFFARAVVERTLAALLREAGQQLNGYVAEQVRGTRTGQATPRPDSTREAACLLALVDGLMMHLLTGQIDTETALAVLDDQLDHVFATPDDQRAHQHDEEHLWAGPPKG